MTPPVHRGRAAETRRPLLEATQLPPRAYVDEEVADWEAERLFLGGWVCVGHAQPLASRGAFFTRDIGGESLLFMGDDEGRAHGFFNVCRHRGARLVSEPEGTMRRLQCPYHAWCYGFDGSLKSAPHTEEIENFGRRPASTASAWRSATASCSPTSPATAGRSTTTSATSTPHLEHYRLGELERAGAITYDVEANWKAIVENYSECLHCPGVHPELNRLSHYESGEEYDGAGAWCGGSMTLNEGAETMAQNGGHGLRPPIARPDREGAARRPLLRALPQPARQPAPRLRDGPHAVAARRRAAPRSCASGSSSPRRSRGRTSIRATRSSSGTWSTARTGTSASSSSAASARAATCPGRYTDTELTVHAFDQLVAEAYLTR